MEKPIKKYPLKYKFKIQEKPVIQPGSVVAENLVFLSGSTGTESDKVISGELSKQVIKALENLDKSLRETGSRLENLVKYYIFLKDTKPSLWSMEDSSPVFPEERPGSIKKSSRSNCK